MIMATTTCYESGRLGGQCATARRGYLACSPCVLTSYPARATCRLARTRNARFHTTRVSRRPHTHAWRCPAPVARLPWPPTLAMDGAEADLAPFRVQAAFVHIGQEDSDGCQRAPPTSTGQSSCNPTQAYVQQLACVLYPFPSPELGVL